MSHITRDDFTRLQSAILALHSHRDLYSFRRAVPGIFMSLIPSDYFSLIDARVDRVRRTVKVLDVWESRPVRVGAAMDAFERQLFDHPFTQHALKHGMKGALRMSDFLTLEQLRRTRFYRDVVVPAGAGRVLTVGAMGGPGIAALSLSRPETAPDFTERDRQLLEALGAHFNLARSNLEREASSRATRSRSLKAHGLTPREIEVALWLAQGKTNPELAVILASPVRTIEKHVEHILHKLDARHRTAAAVSIASIVHA